MADDASNRARTGGRLVVCVVLVGCFHDAAPTAPAAPAASTHTCATASAHLGDALRAGRRTDPRDVEAFVAAVERSCSDDQWPVAALACIDEAATHDAMKQCGPDHLTPAQMQHVEVAAKATHHEHVATPGGALTVESIAPALGNPNGGTYARIRGTSFLDPARDVKVYFGSRQGTVVRIASDDELVVEAPGGTAGELVDVLVIFDPGGERRLPRAFTFVTP